MGAVNWIMAAVKDWQGKISGKPGISYVYGKMDASEVVHWSIPQDASITERKIHWTDGKST